MSSALAPRQCDRCRAPLAGTVVRLCTICRDLDTAGEPTGEQVLAIVRQVWPGHGIPEDPKAAAKGDIRLVMRLTGAVRDVLAGVPTTLSAVDRERVWREAERLGYRRVA